MESIENEALSKQNVSNHLANERTLLAWVRTGVGIMAFGFVVVKFSLFIKQIALVLGDKMQVPQYGYSAPIGTMLVGVGSLTLVLSLLRYRKTKNQLNANKYRHSPALLYAITGFVIIAGLCLLFYLIKTT